MAYTQCGGTSFHPKRNSIEYVMAGNIPLPWYGKCSHCDKRCALTVAGNIRAHKDARLIPLRKAERKLYELGFTSDFVANMIAAAQLFGSTSMPLDPDHQRVVTVHFYDGLYVIVEERKQ